MQFCRKDVQFIFMQYTLKNRNMIEKRSRRTGEHDEKRFDERSCYKDDAVFCSTNDSGKSAATRLQYCGYPDCWEIFRRRCIGSGWFCLFADDFFKRNHDWIVHGKRNHFFCKFHKCPRGWHSKGIRHASPRGCNYCRGKRRKGYSLLH